MVLWFVDWVWGGVLCLMQRVVRVAVLKTWGGMGGGTCCRCARTVLCEVHFVMRTRTKVGTECGGENECELSDIGAKLWGREAHQSVM